MLSYKLVVPIPLHPIYLVAYFTVDGAHLICGRLASSVIGLLQANQGTSVGGVNNDFAMIPLVAPSTGVQPAWRGQGDVIVLKLR